MLQTNIYLYHRYRIEEQNNNKLSYEIDVCGLKGWIHQVLINKLRNKFVVVSVHSKSLVASTLDGSMTLRLRHINFSTQEFCISKKGHKKFFRFKSSEFKFFLLKPNVPNRRKKWSFQGINLKGFSRHILILPCKLTAKVAWRPYLIYRQTLNQNYQGNRD